jgi:hypothetical protein
MRTVKLNYNVRVPQGHRFSKDSVREWPSMALLVDVMNELHTELESLGCKDITITRAQTPETE